MTRSTAPATFRKMARADVGTVARLVKDYHAFDHIPHDVAHTRAALQKMLRDPKLGEVWLINSGRSVAGYLVLTRCFSLEFHGEVFLDEFFLRAPYRGRGIGQVALAFIAEWAREHDVTAIHVISESNNPAARRAYKRGGFGGAHRFLMTRLVDPPPHLLEGVAR